MQKLVINCAAGAQDYVPLTADEAAEVEERERAAAQRRADEEAAAQAERERERDMAEMLTEWRRGRGRP